MADANRALVQSFYDEVISGGNLDLLDELLAPDFFDHDSQRPPGRAGFRQFVAALRSAFPDLRWTVDDWVVGADKVVARGHANGTHRGEFMGVPPSGKPAEWRAIHIFRIEDGRLAERWMGVDGGLLERLRSAGDADSN